MLSVIFVVFQSVNIEDNRKNDKEASSHRILSLAHSEIEFLNGISVTSCRGKSMQPTRFAVRSFDDLRHHSLSSFPHSTRNKKSQG